MKKVIVFCLFVFCIITLTQCGSTKVFESPGFKDDQRLFAGRWVILGKNISDTLSILQIQSPISNSRTTFFEGDMKLDGNKHVVYGYIEEVENPDREPKTYKIILKTKKFNYIIYVFEQFGVWNGMGRKILANKNSEDILIFRNNW